MPWNPPSNYKPPSDSALKQKMKQMKIEPGKTSMRMSVVIIKGKRPVLKSSNIDPDDDEEEITPAQARYAFHRKWVPGKWVNAMTRIGLSDGRDYWPPDEG